MCEIEREWCEPRRGLFGRSPECASPAVCCGSGRTGTGSLFTFLIFFKLSPDPALMICGKTCTPDRVLQIRTSLGLDKPFLTQFSDFLSGLFAGRDYGSGANLVHCPAPCLGYSFQTNQSVWQMVLDRLPVSASVAVGAAVLWLAIGVSAGLLSAVKEGTWWDRAAMGLALGGASIPNYVLALALQYVLVVKLQVLPFPSAVGFSDDPVGWFESYLMPWVVLATVYSCLYTRLTRTNVIETLAENFMRTARAKGLPPGLVLRRHALRPALTPITAIFEQIFAAPGHDYTRMLLDSIPQIDDDLPADEVSL